MGVHEAAHHYEAKHDLKHYEDVIYAVHRDLMRILNSLDERNNAEGNDKEDCEYYEGDQFRELKRRLERLMHLLFH